MGGFGGMLGGMMGGGGGGGMSPQDMNPYTKAIKAMGVQMETTGRGMATANPRISAAISGAAAGEHSAFARMNARLGQRDVIDRTQMGLQNNILRGKSLFQQSPNIGEAGIHPDTQL